MQILKPGDNVEVILPASGCSEAEYLDALNFIRKFGLTPVVVPYAQAVKDGLCANSVEARFSALMSALKSDSKAIWCLKGGYGSQKLLESLSEVDFSGHKEIFKEKIFIGFSDITILLNYFAMKAPFITCLHGPMPSQYGKISDASFDHLAEILFGQVKELKLNCVALNRAASNLETAAFAAKFLGGCLSLMQTLIGTKHLQNLDGAVLLLEDDRFETPRRVDRVFDHMKRAGVFVGLKAVVLGSFLETDAVSAELQEVFTDLALYLDSVNVPLIQNKNLGHTNHMITVPIGTRVNVGLGEKPEIIFSDF